MADLPHYRATILPFKPRRVRGVVERATTRDEAREHPDGSWSTWRQPPRGVGWEVERDKDRHTVWRRIT